MTLHKYGWTRPLNALENKLYSNNVGVSYVLRICTSRELTKSDLTKGLLSLYRKTSNLRMVVHERNGEMWMKEMAQENLDFMVVENADPRSVFHEMLDYQYPEEGPYWAARYLPWSASQQDYVNLTKMETEQEHPFISHLVLSFHHCLTDGFTILKIISILLRLLDDVLDGRPIDDYIEVAKLIDTKHEQLVYEEIEREFLEQPELLERTKLAFESLITETLIGKAYPAPTNVKPATISLPFIFDKETTKKFIARCKKEKVTFHTGFCTVIDAAIVKFFLDSNLEKPDYKISSRHCIDKRQYFCECDKSFGCTSGTFDMISITPKDVLKIFWAHAAEYDTKFKLEKKQKSCFHYQVMEQLTGIPSSSRMQKANPPHTGFYYTTTNMLDVTSVVGECGSHVTLDYYDRLSTMKTYPAFWLSGFQTFRGQLMHSFMYNVHLMAPEAARKMADSIQEIFSKVTETL